jgi:hypothetical protein
MTELCKECNKHEAEYDHPDLWCTPCWMNWWYEEYTPEERKKLEPSDYLMTAYHDLGNDAVDEDVVAHVLEISRGTMNIEDLKTCLAEEKEEILSVRRLDLDDCQDLIYSICLPETNELGDFRDHTAEDVKLVEFIRSVFQKAEEKN